MDSNAVLLLDLYRSARELSTPAFQARAAGLLQSFLNSCQNVSEAGDGWRTVTVNTNTADSLVPGAVHPSRPEHHVASTLSHLLEATTINRLLGQSGRNAPDADREGFAISRVAGHLFACDTVFMAMLRKEWPAWSPPTLPGVLVMTLRGGPASRFTGASVRVTSRSEAGFLFLTSMEGRAEEPLTAAERRTAELIAEGLSYKQAAAQLHVSPSTVRNQLHSAYEKLGVHSKAALGRALTRM
jgi:DNA-binding CsgD family transcriptional regulator